MKICVVGTGYVGLVAGTCLAEMGNDVICTDNNEQKIEQLAKGKIPIYEPNLEELVKTNVKEGRLFFSTDLENAIKEAMVCFIAVGTPQKENGECNLEAVFKVAKSIGENLNDYKVIVNKSTVPIGTATKVKEIISQYTDKDFDVVSNPEFLKQGGAVEDFLNPDRVIIGSESQRATEIIQEIYCPFLKTGKPVMVMDIKSAEMTKYCANAFLATKISFINEMANICENVGADIENVRAGISTDKRIGAQFLYPGLGYGGSCFPKDVKALINISDKSSYNASILKSVDKVNFNQRVLFINKILEYFDYDVKNKKIAIWGLSFKPKTNDMREAPAITIINELINKGAIIQVFDPKAMDYANNIWGNKLKYFENNYDALYGAHALLLLTEWNEFRRPDFNKIKALMAKPLVFDGRNQYDKERMQKRGFEYFSIGRNKTTQKV